MAGPLRLNSTTRLTLLTLGRAQLVAQAFPDATDVPLLGAGKPLALIAFLAIAPGGTASREHLLDLLWSDLDPDDGRHALRQTLWYLKQRLGEPIVGGAGATLSLLREVRSDRAAFLDALDNRELELAATIYRGEFLPRLALPGGGQFEQWADIERERLRSAFIRSGETLARAWLGAGRHRQAIELARRVRDADRDREIGWRLLLEALLSGSDYLTAAAEADALAQLLQRDEREPEPPTRALLRLARTASPQETVATPARQLVAELVGREADFATIIRTWTEARSQGKRHVHVEGTAGIGKTRLLEDVHARLRASRARVVMVRAAPGERDIAYALAAQLAVALAALPGAAAVAPAVAATLVALDPRLSSGMNVEPEVHGGEDALRRRAAAIEDLVAAVADEAPLALLIDDLHWADRASCTIVEWLLSHMHTEHVLIVTTARAGALEQARDAADALIVLSPLAPSHVAALLATLGELPDEGWTRHFVTALHGASRGLPLLVLETLSLLIERGTLTLADGVWNAPDPGALATSLTEGSALRDRLARLHPGERSVLLACAVAGAPLSTDLLARTTERSVEDAAAVAAVLEKRGLLTRITGEWQPAHDELASTALVQSDSLIADMHAKLGRALLDGRGTDRTLRRAGQHLLAADDAGGLREAFVRWVQVTRALGDDRPAGALAGEFHGRPRDAEAHRALVSALPLRTRFTRRTRRRIALASGLGVLAFVVALRAASRPRPDASLILASLGTTSAEPYEIDIRRDDFSRSEPVDVARVARRHSLPASFLARVGYNQQAHRGPDGWIVTLSSPDSGGLDLYQLSPSGEAKRLTSARDDDTGGAWAPDGRTIVFATGRFNRLSHHDIALLDVRTGAVRPLLLTPDTDLNPVWSPTGEAIAFTRLPWDGSPSAVCRVAPNATDLHCFAMPDVTARLSTVEWLDHHQVLVTGDTREATHLWAVDVAGGTRREIDRRPNAQYWASPGGRWIMCAYRDTPEAQFHTTVFPVDRPGFARELELDMDIRTGLLPLWDGPSRPSAYADQLILKVPGDTVDPRAGAVVGATALSPTGAEVPIIGVAWTVDDTSIATIDSTGFVRPRRSGTVRVRASLGGWRAAEVVIPIAARHADRALVENWTTEWTAFVPYGDPQPMIVRDGTFGHVFWNRGDGSFGSGAYSRNAFDPRAGLAVETVVSTPLTLLQWQVMALRLTGLDREALASWDHTTGGLPSTAATELCATGFPGGERLPAARMAGIAAGAGAYLTAAPSRLWTGNWYRVVLQYFPDGRCGVAIDGVPLAVTPAHPSPGTPVRVVIGQSSFETLVLVGPLTVWHGVRPGIDWRAAPVVQAP